MKFLSHGKQDGGAPGACTLRTRHGVGVGYLFPRSHKGKAAIRVWGRNPRKELGRYKSRAVHLSFQLQNFFRCAPPPESLALSSRESLVPAMCPTFPAPVRFSFSFLSHVPEVGKEKHCVASAVPPLYTHHAPRWCSSVTEWKKRFLPSPLKKKKRHGQNRRDRSEKLPPQTYHFRFQFFPFLALIFPQQKVPAGCRLLVASPKRGAKPRRPRKTCNNEKENKEHERNQKLQTRTEEESERTFKKSWQMLKRIGLHIASSLLGWCEVIRAPKSQWGGVLQKRGKSAGNLELFSFYARPQLRWNAIDGRCSTKVYDKRRKIAVNRTNPTKKGNNYIFLCFVLFFLFRRKGK